MNKKSKKSNFLRNLLTTASIASVIVGGSSAAFGVGIVRQAQDPASEFTNAAHWAPGAVVGNGDSLVLNGLNVGIVGDANKTVTINNAAMADTTLTVDNNTVGVAGVVGVRALTINLTHANAKIILGRNGVDIGNFAVLNEVGNYDGLKTIDFKGVASNALITTDGLVGNIDFLSTGGHNGTVTIDANNVTLNGTWANGAGDKVNKLAVYDRKSVTINSDLNLNNVVTLGGVAGGGAGTINGGTLTIGAGKNVSVVDGIDGAHANAGTLTFVGTSEVIAKIGNVNGLKEINIGGGTVDFKGPVVGAGVIKAQAISLTQATSVMKLSNVNQTVTGSITTPGDNQGTLYFHGNKTHIVDGNVGDANHRLAEIKFEAAAGVAREITGEVFTNNINSDGGIINFGHNVHVSNITDLTAAITTINIVNNKAANFGKVKFNGLGSIINVGAGGTVAGEFETTGNVAVGQIHFAGAGAFNGKATNLALIDITGAGTLEFSPGVNVVTEVNAMVAGAHFAFADGYELKGSINGGAAGVTPNLNFKGNAKITGAIGNNNAGVGDISIAKGKALTVDSVAIRATKIFDKADQGTLILTHKLVDVNIASRISELGGGTIDATGMGATKNLIIAGDIGANPSTVGSNALEKMLLAGQNLVLRPTPVTGFANIAGIDFAKKASTVSFAVADVGYALGNLTNSDSVTLKIDNNISLYNTKTKEKLKEIQFAANNAILTLGTGNDITANAITVFADDQNALVFAGDSALRGPIGTANKQLSVIIVEDNVTATTSGQAFVKQDVTLDGDKSVLVIDSNYTADKFVGGAPGVGTLRFVNKDLVTLAATFTQPAATVPPTPATVVNAINTLELTDGDVKLDTKDGMEFKKVVFTSVPRVAPVSAADAAAAAAAKATAATAASTAATTAADAAEKVAAADTTNVANVAAAKAAAATAVTAADAATAAAKAAAATAAAAAPPTNAGTAATGTTTTAPTAPAVIATAPTLILDRAFVVDADSSFNSTTGKMPTIQLLPVVDNIISANNYIGTDKDHLVNLQLASGVTATLSGRTGMSGVLTVETPKFFATVTTTADNEGSVLFDDKADKVYGVGSSNLKLAGLHVNANVENFGDTYAKEVVVYGGKTYTAGGIIAGGEIRLGNSFGVTVSFNSQKVNNVTGNATVKFNDGVTLSDDMANVGEGNKIHFAGNALINGKIGATGNTFELIKFDGDKTRTATLHNDMFAKVVNFGAENIKIAASKVTIGGTSHIDANIALDSNKLVLQGDGTWGVNTSINTTLTKDGTLGSIDLHDEITVAGNVPVIIKITDEASLKDHKDAKYVFISGYKYLVMKDGSINLTRPLIGITTDQVYADWDMAVVDDNLVFTRISNEIKGVKKDLDGIGDATDQQNAKMLAEATGGDALKYMDNLGRIDEKQGGKVKRAASLQQLMNTESVQVTEVIGNNVVQVVNIVNSRMFNATGQSAAVGAGSDDGSTSMGAWVMPYYSQAVQKNKGGSVGYAVKSGGGIFGFDTLANEDLTIGAAVSIIKSNMKFKGYKAGEKTDIDTLMLSIYGAQQFAKDFFVQAVASFGSSKVNNTDPRIVPVHIKASGQQVAKASYNSMSYGGELLFGYNAKVDDSVLVTPMAGIRYTRFNDGSYKETGTDYQNKIVSQKATNRVEAVVGARVAATVDTGGVVMTPEAHAFVSQRLGGKSGKVDAKLDGMTSPFVTRSDKGAKTSLNVGVGVSAKAGTMEYGAGYDAYLANKYVGHQGTLKVRVNF